MAVGKNRRFAHVGGHVGQLTTSVDHTPWHAQSRFEDFPTSPVNPPFRMDLGEILHKSEIDQIVRAKKLVFIIFQCQSTRYFRLDGPEMAHRAPEIFPRNPW